MNENQTSTRFQMPAEWEPQSATWVSWPHNEETWPDNLLAAQNEFINFVVAVAKDQPVNVMAGSSCIDAARSAIKKKTESVDSLNEINFVEIRTNDAWARDYAPTFVIDRASGELASIDWQYNAWGGKYPPFDADQQVASRVAQHLQIKNVPGELCFEGGAIEINESGDLLTTDSCGLNPNRNPDVSKTEFETQLKLLLGAKRIVWLPGEGIEGDDTDGHIDQIARFTSDQCVVYAWTASDNDPRRAALEQNRVALARQLPNCKLVPLLLPDPFEFFGRLMPASYCNFLITNNSLLVPQFDVPEDEIALKTLEPLFANRRMVPLPSRNLSVGLGSFHCLSQQQPA